MRNTIPNTYGMQKFMCLNKLKISSKSTKSRAKKETEIFFKVNDQDQCPEARKCL